MLICLREGLYLRMRRVVDIMVSSRYLWPFVSEKRLREGRRWSWVMSCLRGFYERREG